MATVSYLALYRCGVLEERVCTAETLLNDCTLCPRMCHVNRIESPDGFCRTGALPVVSGWHPHFGEEAPLVGRRGSGTIFFGSCSLLCAFCQNWTTSRMIGGGEVSASRLARMMVELQQHGCHNVNLVTPTHMVAQILAALPQAIELGVSVPLVYNTSGYDRVETLRLLDGVVDIYMPDIKFMDAASANRYCGAEDYPEVVQAAVKEMHRQVGDLVLDSDDIAVRGLLVRHLVMPDRLADTRAVCDFLARQISASTYLNLMDQYRPCGQAQLFPEINRPIAAAEFDRALGAARDAGLRRLDRDVGKRFS
jgi:putative pyruvate formate lyase activating enzyme